MSAAAPLLYGNVGVESARTPSPAARQLLRTIAELWALLFAAGARLVGDARPPAWPAALGTRPTRAAWPFLDALGGAAWLVDAAAARALPDLDGDPEVVRRVHDKAFAVAAVHRAKLAPEALASLVHVLEPRELRGPSARDHLAGLLSGWPDWTSGRFRLKPRWGTSGRGHVSGERGRLGAISERAFARLAQSGGAILEPALTRTTDLSLQMWLGGDGMTLVGSTRQLVTAQGAWVGNVGHLTDVGRSVASDPDDAALEAAASAIAAELSRAGYRGPCGIDAMRFIGPDGRDHLRPVVEINARWTTGLVALGLLERARAGGGIAPGEAWCFLAGAPRGTRPALAATPAVRALELAEGEEAPALLLGDGDGIASAVRRILGERGIR